MADSAAGASRRPPFQFRRHIISIGPLVSVLLSACSPNDVGDQVEGCFGCEIEILSLATSDEAAAAHVGDLQFATLVGQQWEIVDGDKPWVVSRIDSHTGRFLGRWGERGTGDGEVRAIFALASNQHTIMLADNFNRRVTVFNVGGVIERTIGLPAPVFPGGLGILGDGRGIVALSNGQVAVEVDGVMQPFETLATPRLRLAGPDAWRGGVILADFDEFRVWEVASDLSVSELLGTPSKPHWFGPSTSPHGSASAIISAYRDRDKNVWVFVRRDDPTATAATDVNATDKRFDTHLLVFGPTGELLAERLFDEFVSVAVPEGAILKTVADEGGVTRLQFVKLGLEDEAA